MPRKKKDEFKESVKKKTAYRVGFRCCFARCNKVLISKADNDKGYTTIAEYCHITAASPNGPKYD